MTTDFVRSRAEIEQCVDMYLSMNDWVPVDRAMAITAADQHRCAGRFIRCIRRDGQVVAWLMCGPLRPAHSPVTYLNQMYYCSTDSGRRALENIWALHADMAAYAAKHGYPICLSNGSHMDEGNVFARILERAGWERRGYATLLRVAPGVAVSDGVGVGHPSLQRRGLG